MAVGNVGTRLDRSVNEKMNTYLSRDGGMSWSEMKKGAYIYELGDHGGLIVMGKHETATKEILYSYNEGKTWTELEISDVPIEITNIIIEPLSISQQFVVYGTILQDKEDESTGSRGIVFTVDFKGLHEPQCKGADRAGEEGSDYELWTPYDGRHGDNKCFLGQQVTYVRRRQEAECFNGEELERKIVRSYCPCTDIDYECDVGYIRSELGGCVLDKDYETDKKDLGKYLQEQQAAQCESFGFYTVSQGYRKIPGNRCVGGLDLSPTSVSCNGMVSGLFSFKGLLVLAVLCLVLYFGWPVVEALIIFLPIPDPKDVAERFRKFFSFSFLQGSKDKKAKAGYSGNFSQEPETLGGSDEEGEDDVGKVPNLKKRGTK